VPRGSGWQRRLLAREAMRNVSTPMSRHRLLAYLAVLFGLVVVAQSVIAGAQHGADLRARSEAGHGVLTFQSHDPHRPASIGLWSCEALRDDPRVARAGVLTGGRMTDVDQLGRHQRVISASTGLVPELRRHRVVLGERLPPISGSLVIQGSSVEAGRLAHQPPGVDVNSSIVVPVSAELARVEQCTVVLVVPIGVAGASRELAARLEVEGSPVVASGPGVGADDVGARYLGRLDRWFGVGVGAAAGVLACAVARLRSGELAVYLLSGTSRGDLIRLVLLEQALVAGLFVTGVATAVPFVAERLVSPAATVHMGAAGAGVWVLVAVPASLPEVFRNPLSPVTAT
jgi:hypothetical protein